MNSTSAPLKIPVINFSVQPLTTDWDLTRAQVRRASEEFGCFEAIFDKIPLEIRSAIFGTTQELFDLPLQTKLKNVSDKPYHGYIGQSAFAPLLESMGFDEANIHEKAQSFTRIFWPQGNPNFCETIESYSKQVAELDQMVRRMILESLGVDRKQLEEHLDSANYLLRVMKYKTTTQSGSSQTELGLAAHTDVNFLTILHELNQVEGLQVQNRKGQWISLKPSPDSFVVFIGDSLNAFSNGRLHAASHRVMIMGNETRYSAGLFCVPKVGCVVRTPEDLVDKEHPLMFNPYDYHEFLRFYTTDAGRKAESALKTFCGRASN